jgi:ABC-type oligopeptide transport system ATPase subunit
MQENALIRARGLARRYQVGKQEVLALNGVDLDVERGEFVGAGRAFGFRQTRLCSA